MHTFAGSQHPVPLDIWVQDSYAVFCFSKRGRYGTVRLGEALWSGRPSGAFPKMGRSGRIERNVNPPLECFLLRSIYHFRRAGLRTGPVVCPIDRQNKLSRLCFLIS